MKGGFHVDFHKISQTERSAAGDIRNCCSKVGPCSLDEGGADALNTLVDSLYFLSLGTRKTARAGHRTCYAVVINPLNAVPITEAVRMKGFQFSFL